MRSFNQPFLLFPLAIFISLCALAGTALSAPANPDIRADYRRHLLSSSPPSVIHIAKNVLTVNDAAYVSEVQHDDINTDNASTRSALHHHHHPHHQLKQSGNVSKPLSPKNLSPSFKLYPGSPAGLPTYFHKYAAMKKDIFTHLQAKVTAHLQAASDTLKLLQSSSSKTQGDKNGVYAENCSDHHMPDILWK